MSLETQDFVALLARARDGDRAAVEQLMLTYEPQLRAVAHVRLGKALRPYLDSADLVQSVHRSLMLGLRQDKFDISSPAQLIGLALTLVSRKIARQWQRMRRQQRLDGGSHDSSSLPDMLTSLSDSHADPVRAVELQDQVDQLCAGLTGTERRLIELRLEGCSTAEAARTLGLDADVLRVQLSRLRRRLRQSGVLTAWL